MDSAQVSTKIDLDAVIRGDAALKDAIGYTDEELHAAAQIGYVFLCQGKFREAQIPFEALVALDPKNAYYHQALGLVFQKLGDFEKALASFGQSIAVTSKGALGYISRAECFMMLKQYARAEADLNQAQKKTSAGEPGLLRKIEVLQSVVRQNLKF